LVFAAERNDKDGDDDNWNSLRHAKLQSDQHINTQIYRLDVLPVAQLSVSEMLVSWCFMAHSAKIAYIMP